MIGTKNKIITYMLNQDDNKRFEVKEYKEKRSNKANRYFWKLLTELCNEMNLDLIEEYKKRAKELGICRQWEIPADDANTFKVMWEYRGEAWFVDVLDTTYKENIEYKVINAYYGSSSYNSKQMARLIDNLVQDCKAIGIETKTPEEINSLLEGWR